jgi:hypothetical protein
MVRPQWIEPETARLNREGHQEHQGIPNACPACLVPLTIVIVGEAPPRYWPDRFRSVNHK